MKRCTKCHVYKELTEYTKDKQKKDGLRSDCRSCLAKHRAKNRSQITLRERVYKQRNKERIAAQIKAWRKKNGVRLAEYKRKYNQANRERNLAYSKAYAKLNSGKVNARNAERRARRSQATPIWLTKADHKYIEFLYKKASELTKQTGIQHHIDHIHPLKGKNICGLHVPNNLQILTANENMQKSNKF